MSMLSRVTVLTPRKNVFRPTAQPVARSHPQQKTKQPPPHATFGARVVQSLLSP